MYELFKSLYVCQMDTLCPKYVHLIPFTVITTSERNANTSISFLGFCLHVYVYNVEFNWGHKLIVINLKTYFLKCVPGDFIY